jgi:hypothetical protein
MKWRHIMRVFAVSALIFAAAYAAPASAQSFVGGWTATAHTPGGDVSESLIVTKTASGYSVTAKSSEATPGGPEAGPGTDIVLDGDKFTYKRSLDMGGGKLEINYSGVVSGDSFTGTAEVAGTKVPYNGVRVTAAK